MSDTECDRLWSALDKANQYMEGLEERVLKLEGARPTRKAGDYFPDPAQLDPGGKLTTIALILREMLPPSGIPSPAQRLLLRIKAVVETKQGEAKE